MLSEEFGPWRTSTRSGNSGNCVEVRPQGPNIEVRDTKDRGGGTLTVSRVAWRSFTAALKAGDLDP